VLVEDLRQGRHRHLGDAADRLPAHALGHAQPRAARLRAAERTPAAQAQATREGNREAAAVLGFASAIGAYGGFFIPKSWGSSIALTGGPAAALVLFIVFYLSCIALTWWHYGRRYAPLPC